MSSSLDIAVSQAEGSVSVSVLALKGVLDASTQKELESKAEELIGGGTTHILLDMRGVSYMSSAGLRAMHAIAGKLSPEEASETAIKSSRLKLLSPSEDVAKILKTLGFDAYLESFDDLNSAVASF